MPTTAPYFPVSFPSLSILQKLKPNPSSQFTAEEKTFDVELEVRMVKAKLASAYSVRFALCTTAFTQFLHFPACECVCTNGNACCKGTSSQDFISIKRLSFYKVHKVYKVIYMSKIVLTVLK
jgi:hypothetical protein